jgi:glycosyltransferase involved in cell wall biosynthesis
VKVLFWSEGFWPHIGGIEIFGQQLMEALQFHGFEFAVITSTLENTPLEENHNGIQIFRVPMRQGLMGRPLELTTTLKKVSEIKQEFRPDVYHLNISGPSFFYHLQTLKSHAASTIFTFHYLVPLALKNNGLLTKMMKHSDWVTGVSKAALDSARAFSPSITSRSSFIYNGLKTPLMQTTPLSPDARYIMSWGRLVPNKGFDLMLKAFASIAHQYPHLDYWLMGDGPDKERLKAMIDDLGIQKRVHFPGQHISEKELFTAIRDARLIVLPSHDPAESFGLSALEAMQMARPVVTSNHPGLVEVVLHQKTGLLFEMHQMNSLVTAITTLLNDFQCAKEYGLAGKKHAESFTLDRMVNEYKTLYTRFRSF